MLAAPAIHIHPLHSYTSCHGHTTAAYAHQALRMSGNQGSALLQRRRLAGQAACHDSACLSGNRPCLRHGFAARPLLAPGVGMPPAALSQGGTASFGQSGGNDRPAASVEQCTGSRQQLGGAHLSGGAAAAQHAQGDGEAAGGAPFDYPAHSQSLDSQGNAPAAQTASPPRRACTLSCGLSVYDPQTAVALACFCPAPGCKHAYGFRNAKPMLNAEELELAQHQPQQLARIARENIQVFCVRDGRLPTLLRLYLRHHWHKHHPRERPGMTSAGKVTQRID